MVRWIACCFFILVIVSSSTAAANYQISQNKNTNIYSDAGPNELSPTVKNDVHRVYVPNRLDNTLSIIDPKTYKVINTIPTGKTPEHVIPSYDLKKLYVLNYASNSIGVIDAKTGKKLNSVINVKNPYNLYYTPDGKFAIVMNDQDQRFDFRDPESFKLIESVPVGCGGLNHMDFTADGLFALASCEYSGELVVLDVTKRKIIKHLKLVLDQIKTPPHPQDVRLSPDGKKFFVADMTSNGVFIIDAETFKHMGFIKTGIGTHSVYPSRNGKYLYICNRGCNLMENCPKKGPGDVVVLDPVDNKIMQRWKIPGGGSPDMGNVNADGTELWLSGKYDEEVYVFDTVKGQLKHRIPVGKQPHGLCVWPLPGRYSLGHTGNMR